MVKRTFGEWRDFLYYIPACLDGGAGLVHEELRADLCAAWQLLMVIVFSAAQRVPFTSGELEVIWVDCIRQYCRHVDALGRTIETHLAGQDEDDAERLEAANLRHTLARINAEHLLRQEVCPDEVEEAIQGNAGEDADDAYMGAEIAGLCFGDGIKLPFNLSFKTKIHLADWSVQGLAMPL